jgi:transketolase
VASQQTNKLEWSDLDERTVNLIRVLAMDAVENEGSGHPGTAMSLAPAAYLLYQRIMRHDPTDPAWTGRDRFVLSCGHSSLTLYIQLYLSGYGLTLDDLKAYRSWGSLTPGHPEHGLTAGVQELGNLIVLYDDNHISIEDDTVIAKDEDTAARYEAYGWHVQRLNWDTPDGYHEDVQALYDAFEAARAETSRPSFISLRTIIGWPAPNKQGTGAAHGSALGDAEVAATKKILGFNPDVNFPLDADLVDHAREVIARGQAAHAEWAKGFGAWAGANAERKALFDRMSSRTLPDGWAAALPEFKPDAKGVATRKASGEVLSALAKPLPELWGGSADLAGSNDTTMKGEPSFLPHDRESKMFPGNKYGRTLHFGIREHAMGAIMNGIALHGGTRVYGGTFLTFSDYMRGAVRLAALMELPVTYVWTHDSIGLGEDGPTHQPIEHLWALRAIPHLAVVRPGDANETVAAWKHILEHPANPSALALSRQNRPVQRPGLGGRGGQGRLRAGRGRR